MRNVPSGKVRVIAGIINRHYKLDMAEAWDRECYDGRKGTILRLDCDQAINASNLDKVRDYCHKHGIFVEPINDMLLGVYFV